MAVDGCVFEPAAAQREWSKTGRVVDMTCDDVDVHCLGVVPGVDR